MRDATVAADWRPVCTTGFNPDCPRNWRKMQELLCGNAEKVRQQSVKAKVGREASSIRVSRRRSHTAISPQSHAAIRVGRRFGQPRPSERDVGEGGAALPAGPRAHRAFRLQTCSEPVIRGTVCSNASTYGSVGGLGWQRPKATRSQGFGGTALRASGGLDRSAQRYPSAERWPP
jgi:hypothetical protein